MTSIMYRAFSSAAMLLMLGVAAHADIFCDSLAIAVKLSPTKFVSIRGEQSREDYGWGTTFRIAGAQDCGIQKQEDGEVNLYCEYNAGSFVDVRNRITACMKNWQNWKIEPLSKLKSKRAICFSNNTTAVRLWESTISSDKVVLDISDFPRF